MVPPLRGSHRSLSLRVRVCHSNTRTYVRLLGPCFKTGRCDEFRPPGSGAPRARGRITCPKASYLVPGRLRDRPQAARTARSDKTRPRGGAEDRRRAHFVEALPFGRFQALFNSLFKVLCIFPSRYLFAIGLSPLFSFRWNLPPTLNCTPKQFDSTKAGRTCCARTTDGTVTLYG